jgi:hypothetical protein
MGEAATQEKYSAHKEVEFTEHVLNHWNNKFN